MRPVPPTTGEPSLRVTLPETSARPALPQPVVQDRKTMRTVNWTAHCVVVNRLIAVRQKTPRAKLPNN